MDDAAEIIERVRAHIGSVLHGLRLVIGADPRALDVGGRLFLDDVLPVCVNMPVRNTGVEDTTCGDSLCLQRVDERADLFPAVQERLEDFALPADT